LRYFYPKGTRFEHISAQDLTTTLLQINQRPLKYSTGKHRIRLC
ncbi:IS30 family transposase, partial [Latilactobacillus curvatus]|nr:IS30 family transposase [Latilactobacillus curvatus]